MSISAKLDRKWAIWPEPERSIGRLRTVIKGERCWEPRELALEAFKQVSPLIHALLDSHWELIEEGEEVASAVSFNMWMIGRNEECAQPTIVFASRSKRSRKKAMNLVKDKNVLADFPGIALRSLKHLPATAKAMEEGSQAPFDGESENHVYTIGSPTHACGAPIIVGFSRKATLGGVLLIADVLYGITVNHVRSTQVEESDYLTEVVNEIAFDDSDDDLDDEHSAEIMSRGSISSGSGSDTDTTSESEDIDIDLDVPTESLDREARLSFLIPTVKSSPVAVGSPCEEQHKISTITSQYVHRNLDYEIFLIVDPKFCGPNKIILPSKETNPENTILIKSIAQEVTEKQIWAATGPTGPVKGHIGASPYFIKMAGAHSFQEMWPVQLERAPMAGDCGAWVVDAFTGELYGHIVASDALTDLAYIIPAHKVFDDIQMRLNKEVVLPIESTEAPPISTTDQKCDSRAQSTTIRSLFLGAETPSYRALIMTKLREFEENNIVGHLDQNVNFSSCLSLSASPTVTSLPGDMLSASDMSSPSTTFSLAVDECEDLNDNEVRFQLDSGEMSVGPSVESNHLVTPVSGYTVTATSPSRASTPLPYCDVAWPYGPLQKDIRQHLSDSPRNCPALGRLTPGFVVPHTHDEKILSVSDSSFATTLLSGYESPNDRRHISFSDEVAQCIAIDAKEGEEGDDCYDNYNQCRLFDDEELSDWSKTIAPLPPTTLKYGRDAPEDRGAYLSSSGVFIPEHSHTPSVSNGLLSPVGSDSASLHLDEDLYDDAITLPLYDEGCSRRGEGGLDHTISTTTFISTHLADQSRSELPATPSRVGDDNSIENEPTRHVDYLSHDWREEDIWTSWRYITTRRNVYSNSTRLENASWRTWAKLKYGLRTVTPESLNWLKDCDVTWLYGPLQTHARHDPPFSSSPPPTRFSTSNSFLDKKPILKKRTVSQTILQRSLATHTLLKHAGAILKARAEGSPRN